MTYNSKALLNELVAKGISYSIRCELAKAVFDDYVSAKIAYRELLYAPAPPEADPELSICKIDAAYTRLFSCRQRLSMIIDSELSSRGLPTSRPSVMADTVAQMPLGAVVKRMVFEEADECADRFGFSSQFESNSPGFNETSE